MALLVNRLVNVPLTRFAQVRCLLRQISIPDPGIQLKKYHHAQFTRYLAYSDCTVVEKSPCFRRIINSRFLLSSLNDLQRHVFSKLLCNVQPSQATANPIDGKACSPTKGGLLCYIVNTYSLHKVSSS